MKYKSERKFCFHLNEKANKQTMREIKFKGKYQIPELWFSVKWFCIYFRSIPKTEKEIIILQNTNAWNPVLALCASSPKKNASSTKKNITKTISHTPKAQKWHYSNLIFIFTPIRWRNAKKVKKNIWKASEPCWNATNRNYAVVIFLSWATTWIHS